MKTVNKYIIAATICAAGVGTASAQTSYSGYFLENFNQRYLLNPALADTLHHGFVGMPVLGNMNVGIRGNMHVSSLLYNVDGRTVLFTNPGVSASEVMKNVHDKNRLGAGVQLDLLAAGWKAWGGFNAVTVSAVADAEVSMPGSLISLMKEGVANQTYDIKQFGFKAQAYGQIQLNHSREIKQVPGLRAGAAIKFLLGLGEIDARFKQAELALGTNSWNVRADAEIRTSIKGARYETSHSDHRDADYVSGLKLDGFGVNGFGMGFDLGASYKWRDFEFSLALLDIGFMNWNNSILATTGGLKEFTTDAYTFEVNDNGNGSSDDTWDDMTDDLSKLYELEDRGNTGGNCRSLHTTLNWGVEYTLPYYRRLKFGLVNSTVFNGQWTATDFRLSANVTPVDILSASANLSMGTYGVGFGWLLNLNLKKGFSLFVGMDRTLGKVSKQFVPLNSNANVNFGINYPF